MNKIKEEAAVPVDNTGFENKIGEDPNSNAGMFIQDVHYDEAGIYSVENIGNPPVQFEFTVSGANVHATNITIDFMGSTTVCKETFTCNDTFERAGKAHVIVDVLAYNTSISFPQDDAYYTVGEESKLQLLILLEKQIIPSRKKALSPVVTNGDQCGDVFTAGQQAHCQFDAPSAKVIAAKGSDNRPAGEIMDEVVLAVK
ncbi:hypothetical protein LSH36_1462g00004 [Paralvinella palmiformis]|uniref:Uncharacterized protein n=1 Tax=Paralvinella palmiformis TaxID=53620 RepID=A0AAD9IT01_9ANNE|nr:hypothetical protein LSH36_1462g00004 [Paralvinella palmiformis]